MSIKASGRSALIIAAGLWLGFAGPMRATDSAAEPAGLASHTESAGAPVKLSPNNKSHKRHARTRKSTRPETKAHETTAAEHSDRRTPLPPAVADANANAEMPGGIEDSPKTEAGALASSAGQMLSINQGNPAPQAGDTNAAAVAEIVSPDELNEIDRALIDDKPAEAHLALASIDIAPSASSADAAAQAVTASDNSTWNHTSLIGKIFIAFGGLLTLGSAARMFMA